jgi:hypothetical protein
MPKTHLSIDGESFAINGKLTYSEIAGSNSRAHGLLMNARFIQGIFDDKNDRDRYNRWGRTFDPDTNTNDLIKALPEWYKYGLRAFTTGFQGGGPCFTTDNMTIHNNPFGEDGTILDPAYADRMDRLIRAADEIGMIVIPSFFYGAQARRLRDGKAVRNAVAAASRFLRDGGYTNVIIEVANEQDIAGFEKHAIIKEPEGMAMLIDLAREQSGGLPVGCSGGGNSAYRDICEASDVILIHGNGCSRQRLYELIRRARSYSPGKPVVINEDSQAIGQLDVAYATHTSWGYYNNLTKQEPPADWRVTPGEDMFFAMRMAQGIGIDIKEPEKEQQYYLQGLEPEMTLDGKRWLRVAGLYPETIDYVEFFRNGESFYTCYDEPFSANFMSNWMQGPVLDCTDSDVFKAEIHLRDGTVVEKEGKAG